MPPPYTLTRLETETAPTRTPRARDPALATGDTSYRRSWGRAIPYIATQSLASGCAITSAGTIEYCGNAAANDQEITPSLNTATCQPIAWHQVAPLTTISKRGAKHRLELSCALP